MSLSPPFGDELAINIDSLRFQTSFITRSSREKVKTILRSDLRPRLLPEDGAPQLDPSICASRQLRL
jgi:hypothetical protein